MCLATVVLGTIVAVAPATLNIPQFTADNSAAAAAASVTALIVCGPILALSSGTPEMERVSPRPMVLWRLTLVAAAVLALLLAAAPVAALHGHLTAVTGLRNQVGLLGAGWLLQGIIGQEGAWALLLGYNGIVLFGGALLMTDVPLWAWIVAPVDSGWAWFTVASLASAGAVTMMAGRRPAVRGLSVLWR